MSTGLASLDVTSAPTFDEVVTARGRFWAVRGSGGREDPQVTQYRPIQPRTSVAVVAPGLVAHGALVTSLASHDIAGVDPVLSTPTTDLAASAPEAQFGDASWPARPATITTYDAPYGAAQDLVLVPGQFIGSSTGGTGRQRLFDRLGVRVLYSPPANTDYEAPIVDEATGIASGSGVAFSVRASDPNGTVRRVLVGYHDTNGSWRFVDLVGSGNTWTGGGALAAPLAAGQTIEYIVQAVDAAGNVAAASNKAIGYDAGALPPPTGSLALISAPVAPPSGWNSGNVTVTATASAGATIELSTGGAFAPYAGPIIVSAEGVTVVTARASDGSTAELAVRIDRSDPEISTPASTTFPAGPAPAFPFTCSDAGSGIASCTATAIDTDSPTAPGVTRSFTITAVDVVGRTATKRVDYTVDGSFDTTPPTITATISPTPNAAGWVNAPATVSFTCADSGSGIPAVACPAAVSVTADGVATITRTVHDRAGNTASASATVQLDRVAPVVTLAGEPTSPACTTSDALSGVAAAAALTTVTTRVNGIPTTTATCAGATDLAGNTAAPVTKTYVAPMTFSGFFAPVDNPAVVNTGNAGRTYPVKWQLRDAVGGFISVLPAINATTYQSVSCATFSSVLDPLPTSTAGNSGLSYDAATNTFQYNWKTPSQKGCYVLRIGLADGTTKVADFNLK